MMKTLMLKQIKQSPKGAISYGEYIGTALYHPEEGYYTKDTWKIGKKGDFYTTSNVSDVYGTIMAHFFLKMAKQYNLPVAIYEFGGGNGRFAKGIVSHFLEKGIENFTYHLIESSPYHRQLQMEVLQGYPQVFFYQSIDELFAIEGIVFSNELFDAFPVHVIEQFEGEVYEIWVTEENEILSECYFPLENEDITTYLKKHDINLQEGQRYEIPLSVERFLTKLAEKMIDTVMVTVDYGYQKEELKEPALMDGSLRGYYQHQQYNDVLRYPGEMDITHHIHIDEYLRTCEGVGMTTIQVTKQKEFLFQEGIIDYFQNHDGRDPFSKENRHNRGILSLLTDGGISDFFTVMVQRYKC